MKRFYDIHFHAMNFSHPNVYLMQRRVNPGLFIIFVGTLIGLIVLVLSPIRWLANLIRAKAPFVMKLIDAMGSLCKITRPWIHISGLIVPCRIIRFLKFLINVMDKIRKKVLFAKNLVSVMDNSMYGYFSLIDKKLHDDKELFPDNAGGKLKIGKNLYDRIVITPLMIDFGQKTFREKDIFYNEPSEKPIKEQVIDVFGGIKKYRADSALKAFEIFPFLGINPMLLDVYSDWKNPEPCQYIRKKILRKYFDDYEHDPEKLWANMDCFTGDINEMTSNFFAGIKVYPPMGFDPWPPEKEEKKLKAVNALYKYCCENAIPITTHASDGGFMSDKRKDAVPRSAPSEWGDVLKNYPELKLNFAHFGKKHIFRFSWTHNRFLRSSKWIKQIMEFIRNDDYPNVYVDISYFGMDENDFESVEKTISRFSRGERDKIIERILFGSDFMINLLDIDSYNTYLKNFSRTRCFTDDEKDMICSENPHRFLFGKTAKMKCTGES